jgi:hypothetical protein
MSKLRISRDQALRGDHFEEFEEERFLLPCGHEQLFFGGQPGSMSASECLRLRCEICGQRAAERHDEWRSALRQFREKRKAGAIHWARDIVGKA